MPMILNRNLKCNAFQCLHTSRQKHDWLPLTYPGVPKYLWEIPPKNITGTYVPYKERQRMGFDDLMTEEELQKRKVAWGKDKHKHYSVQWIDENGVNHIGPPQAVNPAAVQVVGAPPRAPVHVPNAPAVIPTESKPVFNDLWTSMWGRKAPEGEIRVQKPRFVRNAKREDLMEMDVTPEEQAANGLGVTNGTQLSDGSIGTAPHVPLHTFLSLGNDGARAAHDITHTQALYPQPAYFPASVETKAQQGDKAYHPFKFEAPMLAPSSFGMSHVNVHYKTNDPSIADQSFSTTHLGVDEFGTPFPPGEQTQFSQNVVRQRTNAAPDAPFQDAKQLTPYAQGVNACFIKDQLQRIERTYGPDGPTLNDIEDSSHIPTEQFLQKLEKRGAEGGNEAQKRPIYSGSTPPTVIPSELITGGEPVQAPQVFQKLRKKKMT